MRHILDGTDHLLFIACLVIPFRRLKPVLIIVTAFTVAHSITLIASAFGFGPDGLWFPPLVETLIAASIVYMAIENIFGTTLRRRWITAFVFGLVHGFGFAFALRETLQFAGSHLVSSLLAFNVGIELGQVAVLLVLVPLLNFVFRFVPVRLGTIVLSVLVSSHRMALDGRPRRTVEKVSVTHDRRRRRSVTAALADGGGGARRTPLVGGRVDHTPGQTQRLSPAMKPPLKQVC